MYSVLPAFVAALFLGYGLYVVSEKGFNRVSTSFFVLCITTFFWQATWAVLFQVKDPELARALIKFGYLLILFLPTSLYQFLAEISQRYTEQRWVRASYAFAGVLGVFDIGSSLFVDGYYHYFFGYYPKAGLLHPLHVLQTVVVVNRGLYITWRQQRAVPDDQRTRLRLCVASVLIYFFAAVDYLCNYGVEFYPPGVIFVAISLGLIAVAVTRYNLLSPLFVAATVAHEMRTPLASIRMQADALARLLPEMARGWQLAREHGLLDGSHDPAVDQQLQALARGISQQVDRSNVLINMMLASSRMEHIDDSTFTRCSMAACVADAVASYPFRGKERHRVSVRVSGDFEFFGSDALMVYVLFNLIKNSLYAIQSVNKGQIDIAVAAGERVHRLTFTDTATGIPAGTVARIFDTFFTTKNTAGAGIGLAFCRRAVVSFGGRMHCESVEGSHTTFIMEFSRLEPGAALPRNRPGQEVSRQGA